MSRTFDSVIFDLDGTLIDSAPGIWQGITLAFNTLGLQPVQPFTHSIIGPPLRDTFQHLAGTQPPDVIDRLVATFKMHYDTSGFLATQAYPGVALMLKSLSEADLPLFVATNKRQKPTEQIIEMLQWGTYFKAVYSLDSLQPAAANKAALIKHIIDAYRLRSTSTLYVGDRHEDGVAANRAGTQFFHATWGYESSPKAVPFDNAGDMPALVSHIGIPNENKSLRTASTVAVSSNTPHA